MGTADISMGNASSAKNEGMQKPVSVSLQQELQQEESSETIAEASAAACHNIMTSDSEQPVIPISSSAHEDDALPVENEEGEDPSKQPPSTLEARAPAVDTSKPGTNKIQPIDISRMTEEERDALATLQLRFSFQDKTISRMYNSLTLAGWVYYPSERKYLPPDYRDYATSGAVTSGVTSGAVSIHRKERVDDVAASLMTANEVAEHLDYYSIEADLFSDLQIPSNQYASGTNNATAVPRLIAGGYQEERWRKLRDDAIYHFFVTDLKKQGRTWDEENEGKENTDTSNSNDTTDAKNIDENDETTGKAMKDIQEETYDQSGGKTAASAKTAKPKNVAKPKAKPSRRHQAKRGAKQQRGTSSNSMRESATTADVGADMFMKKNSIQARHARKKKSLVDDADAEEEEDVAFERLSLDDCRTILKDRKQAEIFDYYEISSADILETYEEQMNEWAFILGTNHSLLFYGYGSKLNLLNVFAEKMLSNEGYVVVLNGFDSDISAESILDLFVELFLDGLEPAPLQASLPGFVEEDAAKITTLHQDQTTNNLRHLVMRKIRDPVERAKAIACAIAKAQGKELYPIFLVVHNLEGAGLRNRLAQEILSTLVAEAKVQQSGVNVIRLVASIDHVDASSMLWSVNTVDKFRWMWQEVHTYQPYMDELVMLERDEINTSNTKKRRAASIGGSKRQQRAIIMDGQGADRVMEVLRNLANRYTEVMQNLATMQLEAPRIGFGSSQQQKIQWVDMAHLLQQCLNKCTVKSDSQLRTFLSELEDHDLVVVQKQGSTSVMVRIPYSDDKLHEILAFQPMKN